VASEPVVRQNGKPFSRFFSRIPVVGLDPIGSLPFFATLLTDRDVEMLCIERQKQPVSP
jgi:hypothetical protein